MSRKSRKSRKIPLLENTVFKSVLELSKTRPDLLHQLPSPVKDPHIKKIANKARLNARANARRETREDRYYGEPEKLRAWALIRLIMEESYPNEDLIEYLQDLSEPTVNAPAVLTPNDLKITIKNPAKIFSILEEFYTPVPGAEPDYYPAILQKEFLELLEKKALNELYRITNGFEIRRQKERDEKQIQKYGRPYDTRGGRKRKTRRKQ